MKVIATAYANADRYNRRTPRLHRNILCRHLVDCDIKQVNVLQGDIVRENGYDNQADWCLMCADHVTPESDWREQGRCWDATPGGYPDLWMDYKDGDVTAAIICNTCPVRQQCADEVKGSATKRPGMVYAGMYQQKKGGWKRIVFSKKDWTGLEWWVLESGRLPVTEDEWRSE